MDVNTGQDEIALLVELVRRNPEWGLRLRRRPFAIRFGGRWHNIREVRSLGFDLELLCDGRRLRLPRDVRFEQIRRETAERLVALLRQAYPGVRVDRLSVLHSASRHEPAFILRAVLKRRGRQSAVLATTGPCGSEGAVRLVGRLIRWFDQTGSAGGVLLIPFNWNDYIVELLKNLSFAVECHKFKGDRSWQIFPRRHSDTHFRSPYVLLPMQREPHQRIASLAGLRPDLDLLFRRSRWELAYRGYPVLWQEEGGVPLFDLRRPRVLADEGIWRDHVAKVVSMRREPAPDRRSRYFRYAPERWLESLVVRQLSRMRSDLEGPVYCQVPTYIDGDRKVIDLLAVNQKGRLIVVELKSCKDPGLFLQGLEYWQRVYDHLRNGDFERSGYFEGIALSQDPPRLVLVSPLFEFHRDLAIYRAYTRPAVEVDCIGVNMNWREKLLVVRRFSL